MLLNKSISLNDIEAVDPNLFTSLKWMLENSITDVIDTTFSVEHDSFGVIKVSGWLYWDMTNKTFEHITLRSTN